MPLKTLSVINVFKPQCNKIYWNARKANKKREMVMAGIANTIEKWIEKAYRKGIREERKRVLKIVDKTSNAVYKDNVEGVDCDSPLNILEKLREKIGEKT